MNCPFLGLEEDPSTSFSYPSIWNYCNLAKPPNPPKMDHQEVFCLGNAYETCPVILRQQGGPLPPEIRTPGSKPVWGVNQWKIVLAVLFILLLAVIGWQVFAQVLISTALDGHIATPGETGVPQSSGIFPGLTSTTSKTASYHPTTTPTPSTTPTASSTSTRYLPNSSITPTKTSVSVVFVQTITPTSGDNPKPTGTPTPTDTPTRTNTPTPTDTPTPTNTPTPTDTPTPTNTPIP